MENFIHNVLAAVMLLLVFAASRPVPDKLLLEQIEKEAMEMRNKTYKVKMISWPVDNGACWNEFFCLAEQALEKIPSDQSKPWQNLTMLLKTYNRNNLTNCQLADNHKIDTDKFLDKVAYCAKLTRQKKDTIIRTK